MNLRKELVPLSSSTVQEKDVNPTRQTKLMRFLEIDISPYMPVVLGNCMNIYCEGEKLNNKGLHSGPDVY